MEKKVFIKTFGCQMNEYDSNRIYDSVKKIGFHKSDNQEDTDCYILNTCHIRDKAKEKVYHEIGRVKKIYKDKKKPILVVAGCVAQAESSMVFEKSCFYWWCCILHIQSSGTAQRKISSSWSSQW